MSDKLLHYSDGVVQVVFENDLLYASLPENMKDRFEWELRRDMDKAAELGYTVVCSSRLMAQMAASLSGLFLDSTMKPRKAVEQLVGSSKVDTWRIDQLKQLNQQIRESLITRYSSRSPLRRKALGERLLSNPDALEAEVLGWQGLLKSQHSEVIDSRENYVEDTAEVLCRFRSSMFLLATCKTGKVVVLPVSAEVKSCEEAQQWLAGDTIKGFALPKFYSLGRS